MIVSKMRKLVLVLLCGLVPTAALVSATSAAAATTHHVRHHMPARHARRGQSGIPQHNGGDRDSDNNGAPSDGDGNQ
jgi:hypothetical protein